MVDRRPSRLLRRRLNGGCPENVLGDVNSDCVFDVADLNFLQRYLINVKVVFKDKARQLQTMDFDGKGTVDGKDANMALLTLAKKISVSIILQSHVSKLHRHIPGNVERFSGAAAGRSPINQSTPRACCPC